MVTTNVFVVYTRLNTAANLRKPSQVQSGEDAANHHPDNSECSFEGAHLGRRSCAMETCSHPAYNF